MSGTKDGAAKSKDTNIRRYGEDYYRRIGALGGAKGRTGGFAAGEAGRERARYWGVVGGRISKRPPNNQIAGA